MGKKNTFREQDPILSSDYKYDKRKKERQQEREQLRQQREIEEQRKLERLNIEKLVDEEIANNKHKAISKANSVKNQKNSILNKVMGSKSGGKKKDGEKKNSRFHVNQAKITKFSIGSVEQQSISQVFQEHFNKNVDDEPIEREVIESRLENTGEQVQREIRGMFGVAQPTGKQKIIEQDGSPFILNRKCKSEKQVLLNGSLFTVSESFLKHKNEIKMLNSSQQLRSLSTQTEGQEEKAMKLSYDLVDSYCDSILIQNQEEQSIEQFRERVLAHGIRHIHMCASSEKGLGFTRCKLLILTPFVGDSRSLFDIIDNHFQGFAVENRDKYDSLEDENDFFRVGISINLKRKTLKYFSKFQNSDIIVASPVGLISSSSSDEGSKTDFSYLSSVDIMYVDRASVLMMQNWSHVMEIARNLNRMPKYESLSVSIDQIRNSFLSLKSRIFRQNIVFTEFNFPELNALKINFFNNWKGAATNVPFYPLLSIESSTHPSQHFYKIAPKQPKDDLDYRFDFFKRKFWDQLHNEQKMKKVVIMVNSYFQFVKLKAFLQRVNASAECICEHTKKDKVQSRLARFNNGVYRILLMTERAYYFEVCRVQRFNFLYCYSLPKNSFIYRELLGGVLTGNQSADQMLVALKEKSRVVAIYNQFDHMIIERLVGTHKSHEMMTEYCNNVSFII